MEIAEKVRKSFEKQGLMKTLGATMDSIDLGEVTISCIYSEKVSQQLGFFHAGAITSIVDSACGYAALTLMPENFEVLSVEFKINLLKPANTNKIVAIGKVLQHGKKLTICEGWVYNEHNNKLLAKMTATMIGIERQF